MYVYTKRRDDVFFHQTDRPTTNSNNLWTEQGHTKLT